MRILLVMPNYRLCSDDDVTYPTEANGVACLASYLESKNYEVKILDAATEELSVEEVIQKISENKPDVLGFSVYQSAYEYTKKVILKLRKIGYKGHITMGGHFATFQYEKIFKDLPQLDSICIGEGEQVLLELVQSIEMGKAINSVLGVVTYDKKQQEVKLKGYMPLIEDLSQLPWQSRCTLNDILKKNSKIASMISSRGCYGRCSYCSINAFYSLCEGNLWRERNYNDVLDEMEMLLLKYDINLITFYDDNFIGPKGKGVERAYKFAKEKIRRNIKISYAISCRANDIDKDLFEKLKESGLAIVYLGIESMSERILKVYNKGITKSVNMRALDILEELGLESKIGFILFEPDINLLELKENIEFLKHYVNRKNSNTFYFLKFLRIYSGTDIEKYYLGKNILIKKGFDYTYQYSDKQINDLLVFLKRIIFLIPDMIEKTKGILETELRLVEVSIANWYLDLIDNWIAIRLRNKENTEILEFELLLAFKKRSQGIYKLIHTLQKSGVKK